MRRFPAFENLCACAERTGLQVRILTSGDLMRFAQRRGEEYRQLVRIEMWPSRALRIVEEPLATAPIYGDDIEAAALDLLARTA